MDSLIEPYFQASDMWRRRRGYKKRVLWDGRYKPFYRFTFLDDYIMDDERLYKEWRYFLKDKEMDQTDTTIFLTKLNHKPN
jgi:hypothetical protein